jgi:hypothetical protein
MHRVYQLIHSHIWCSTELKRLDGGIWRRTGGSHPREAPRPALGGDRTTGELPQEFVITANGAGGHLARLEQERLMERRLVRRGWESRRRDSDAPQTVLSGSWRQPAAAMGDPVRDGKAGRGGKRGESPAPGGTNAGTSARQARGAAPGARGATVGPFDQLGAGAKSKGTDGRILDRGCLLPSARSRPPITAGLQCSRAMLEELHRDARTRAVREGLPTHSPHGHRSSGPMKSAATLVAGPPRPIDARTTDGGGGHTLLPRHQMLRCQRSTINPARIATPRNRPLSQPRRRRAPTGPVATSSSADPSSPASLRARA